MTSGDDGGEGPGPASDPGFRPLLDKLSSTYSFDFREYKEPSLARRIRARMSQVHVDTFEADGAAPELIAILRRALGSGDEAEIRWSRA